MKINKKCAEAMVWIALNDNPGNDDSEEQISDYLTVAMVSDLFNMDRSQVARAVLFIRNRQES